MITLRELFDVTWDIVELDITARDPDTTQLVHEWEYGEDIYETVHMYHERKAGRLSIIKGKINAHGSATRYGSETGWGVEEKLFPADIIDAPVTHLSMTPMSKGMGTKCRVDIEMSALTAAKYIVPFAEAEKNEEREKT